MPKDITRPMLSTSFADFALPQMPVASSSALTLDDTFSLPHRQSRRPSYLLSKSNSHSELSKTYGTQSPLASSFTHQPSPPKNRSLPLPRRGSSVDAAIRMRSAEHSPPSASSSAENLPTLNPEKPRNRPRGQTLHTPPPTRKASEDSRLYPKRRLSFPIKQQRILNLLSEDRPAENEVKSEAAFQRLVASGTDLPAPPRTPRPVLNRGRYPEEAVHDDSDDNDSTASDDDIEAEETYMPPPASSTEPISIRRPGGNVVEDTGPMITSEHSSFNGAPIDIDMPMASPSTSVSSLTSNMNHWRHTPPPTASNAVRSNKRKHDDRYDPYGQASKRRAVSPHISNTFGSPAQRAPSNRLPLAIPISSTAPSSAMSSPTITSSYPVPRSFSGASSPTIRASMNSMTSGSPIMRAVPRLPRWEDEREVDHTGDGVNGLSLS